MDFAVYDITLLIIFVVCTSIFLYKRRKNIKKEGFLLLYKARWGIKLIDYIGEKYKKTLKALSYVAIVLGYFLMAGVVYLFGKIIWIYAFQPNIVKLIKVPPILPLFPYLPQVFKLDFLPPFYFIYWIIIIALIAIPHEFFHGIFMRRYGIKIKSTGFGFFPFFLPIFLAAFVEQDEESMNKSKKFNQMAVLSAGTFANILTAIFFFGILLIFFNLSFAPAGVMFNTYPYSVVGITGISAINGISINNASYEQVLSLVDEEGFNEIEAGNKDYLATKSFLENQQDNQEYILLYDDAPAIRNNLSNIIVKINGVNVRDRDELANELTKYSPGDKIIITALEDGADRDYEIILDEHPEQEDTAYLGIGFSNQEQSGILGSVIKLFASFRDTNVYYKPLFNAAEFIYNLLWWLILISFSVALVNMLPVGIFDGGRFFYLTVLFLTKSEKKAKKMFAFITYAFLFFLLGIMIFWAINIFG